MAGKNKSLDSLLEMNEDFCVPDQLFDDSDADVEDIEVKISHETIGNQCKDDNGTLMANNLAIETHISTNLITSSTSLSNQPKQAHNPVSNPFFLQTLPSATTSANVNNSVHSNVPLASAPLKMVSVPVDSNVITQNNSQVVLIPVGGMDSATLQNSLKVPAGQKLVIIKPQEILKTIEQKKLLRNPAVDKAKQPHDVILRHKNVVLQTVTSHKSKQNSVEANRTVLPHTSSTAYLREPASQVVKSIAKTLQLTCPVVTMPPTNTISTVGTSHVCLTGASSNTNQASVPKTSTEVGCIPTQLTHTSSFTHADVSSSHTGFVVSQSLPPSKSSLPLQVQNKINSHQNISNEIASPGNHKIKVQKLMTQDSTTDMSNVPLCKQTGTHIPENKNAENPIEIIPNTSTASQPTSGLKLQSPQPSDNVEPIDEVKVATGSSSSVDMASLTDTVQCSAKNESPDTVDQSSWPTIEQHEETLQNVVIKQRGRPRSRSVGIYEQNASTSSHLSSPSSRNESGSCGRRGRTMKANEPQLKKVKHKQVTASNPWKCALCGKPSYADYLGCLYGPYMIDSTFEDKAEDGTPFHNDNEPALKRFRGSTSESCSPVELWFHGNCIVWSPGVYTTGDTLVGYEQVVTDAQSRMCNSCGEKGATLVCLRRNCRKQFHFYCAKKNKCVFEESNYTIQCGKHVML